MNDTVYDVFINNRPVRIAFLINPNSISFEQIEYFFKYNFDKWGGRYNPIIITDGTNISNEWWTLLRKYDPDVIKSLVKINDKLLKKIDMFLSPYSVEIPRNKKEKGYHSICISDHLISVHPVPEILANVANAYKEDTIFTVFDTKHLSDNNIRKFITYNFGDYPFSYWSKKLFDAINVKTFTISDKESLLATLDELSKFKPYIYPSQLCSIPPNIFDLEYDRMDETFSVFIGDTFEDIFNFWNNSLFISEYRRKNLNQLWIPNELALDSDFQNSIKNWLKSNVKQNNRSMQEVQFTSSSLTMKELEPIVDNLTADGWCHKFVSIINETRVPKFREWYLSDQKLNNFDIYRINSNTEQIFVNKPNIPEIGLIGQQWMADVYIKFGEDRFKFIKGQTFWYKLPLNNKLAQIIFRRESRIGSNGFPSVIMRGGDSRLKIKIPEDKLLFHILITDKKSTTSKWDPRSNLSNKGFGFIRASDKGRYLSGVLSLFEELPSVYHLLEKRYWRRVFAGLSNRNVEMQDSKLTPIKNKLIKKFKKNTDNTFYDSENIEWLADYILQIANELSITSKELPYDFFKTEAEKEVNDFNKSEKNSDKFIFDENDLKSTMFDLMEQQILLIGLSSHCPICGYRNWNHIDESKQSLICSGCNSTYTISTEPIWHYRLNNLVRVAFSYHGVLPVILVLGQLLSESRSSFFYIPNIELLKEWDGKSEGEIDIACIKDGKFIIGEVKNTLKAFHKSDFDRMESLAKFIRPDIILFSSLEPNPNKHVMDNIERIKNNLSKYEIDVQWYQLNTFIFKPTPYF